MKIEEFGQRFHQLGIIADVVLEPGASPRFRRRMISW